MTDENKKPAEQPVIENKDNRQEDIQALQKQLSEVMETNKKLTTNQEELTKKIEQSRGFGNYVSSDDVTLQKNDVFTNLDGFVNHYNKNEFSHPDQYIEVISKNISNSLSKNLRTRGII